MYSSPRQKISKETQVLKDTLEQIDLIGIYRTFLPKAAQYTFFSTVLGYYETRNKLQEKKTAKNTNSWKLNNMLLNNQWIIEEIKEEIKRYIEKWQWRYNNPKPMGHSKSSSEREVYSNTILSQERRKNANKQLTLHLKHLKKEEQRSKSVEGKKS